MNAEFLRIAREKRKPSSVTSAKKQRKKNRMGKTTDQFKKIRDTKGTFHAKNAHIKGRNGKEVKRIHRRTVQKRSS